MVLDANYFIRLPKEAYIGKFFINILNRQIDVSCRGITNTEDIS